MNIMGLCALPSAEISSPFVEDAGSFVCIGAWDSRMLLYA